MVEKIEIKLLNYHEYICIYNENDYVSSKMNESTKHKVKISMCICLRAFKFKNIKNNLYYFFKIQNFTLYFYRLIYNIQ